MSPDAGPQRLRVLAPIVYFAIVAAAHLEFSIWLVTRRQTPFGEFAFAQLVPTVAALGVAALALWLVIAVRGAARPGPILFFWALWMACVALIDRFLTYSLNELAHYPQYALLAWLLARALDPSRGRWPVARILFWTTLLGALDELNQYLWLTPGYGNYFDFNDCVVNLVAAALGVLLYYGFERPPASPGGPDRLRWLEGAVVATGALILCVAAFSGRLVLSPPTQVPPGGFLRDAQGVSRLYLQRSAGQYDTRHRGLRSAHYYVLGPISGLMLLALGGATFAQLPRRARGAERRGESRLDAR